MKIWKVCFLVLFILSITWLKAEEQVVVRFERPSKNIISKFNQNNYDVAAYKPGTFLDIVTTRTEYQKLLAEGYHVTITQSEAQMKDNLRAPADLDGYRDYEETLAELQQLESNYPDICKLYDIGDSRGKEYSNAGNSNYLDYEHDIWALKVSDNVETEEDEPGVYYIAEHHAREPISLEVSMAVLNHIIDNYGTDPQITENVNNTQIWFVPLLNPDGHKIVTDEIELFWRKNLCDNNENSQIDVSGYYPEDGVDPNRNYGWEWGGAGSSWSSETYQGTSAFSEPETQTIRNLLDEHHFVAGISYHSYGQLVLYPFGYANQVVSPDNVAQEELAVEIAIATPAMGGGNYTPQAAWQLYPCTGTSEDYIYGSDGIFAHTVELATEFIPSAAHVPQICDDNIPGAMILLNRVHHSMLKGHVTDATSGEPVVAQIFIEGIDDTGVYRESYESNQDYGSYYRLLTEGSYNVTFSAYGYEAQTFENINITEDNATSQDVSMIPSSSTTDLTGVVINGDTGELIEGATVDIIDFDIPAVLTNENGEYILPDLYEFSYNVIVYANNFAGVTQNIDVSNSNNVIDFTLYPLDDGTFEYGVFENYWEFSGDTDWIIDNETSYNGILSAKSGNIDDDETSSISFSLYVVEQDEISFYKKVSSEADYDYLRFYIDEELAGMWSGNLDWSLVTYPVEEGFHTFKWEYYKDGGVSSYEDCGWIDDIIFPVNSVNSDPNELSALRNAVFLGNYPNPFNPSTTFSYNLKQESKVKLEIYNLKGQKVKTLVNNFQQAGLHTAQWNGKNDDNKAVSSGIYFSRFAESNNTISDYTSVKKIILLK